MTVKETIRIRKSVRSYLPKSIEDYKIQELLEAARLAPSASNRQEWRFVLVLDEKKRRLLADAACGQDFVAQAPCIFICCAETDQHVMTCGQLCYPIDVAIAIDHITLRAVELGLGTCWIGAFYENKVKGIVGIPDEIKVVELLTVGYPTDPKPVPKRRLAVEDIYYVDEWGKK